MAGEELENDNTISQLEGEHTRFKLNPDNSEGSRDAEI
jgi:hypothetical protein